MREKEFRSQELQELQNTGTSVFFEKPESKWSRKSGIALRIL